MGEILAFFLAPGSTHLREVLLVLLNSLPVELGVSFLTDEGHHQEVSVY